jgi:hypothetical protein
VVLSIGINFNAYSQINASILPSKPQKYEKRQLSSDLYTDKKINPFKKGIQNLTTHYNFFFNAERKLNSIITTIWDNPVFYLQEDENQFIYTYLNKENLMFW